MNKNEFQKMISTRVFYLDGATGTNLYAAGMPKGVCTEAWVLEHPQVLQKLQKEYVQAGSNMVYAPTFGANYHMLSAYGLGEQVEEMNKRLVEISRQAVGNDALVAGDLSPSGMMLEDLGGEDTEEEVYENYRMQALALAKTDIDMVGVETMICADEALIAVKAVQSVCDLPIICSITIGPVGRTMYGDKPAEAAQKLVEAGVCAFGLNCSEGPDRLLDVITELRKAVDVPIIAKPNAGRPVTDSNGNSHYEMTPAQFAQHMKKIHEAGATMLGGCCGTTPEYIKTMRQVIEGERKLI